MENTQDYIWRPTKKLLAESYVAKLMKKMGATNRDELWQKSVQDIRHFWGVVEKDLGFEWYEPYQNILNDSKGIAWAKWFEGGRLNIAHHCVDRFQTPQHKNREALVWEGDDGEVRTLTYEEFYGTINQAANALTSLGVNRGDTVGILMPMVPEVVIQLFACFKIGAVAIPIFSGFGAEAIRDRLADSNAKVLFTSDVSFRRGKAIPVKATADAATEGLPDLKARVVFQRGRGECPWNKKLDHWWHDLVLNQSKVAKTVALESEAKSLIIFTSGTTGKPKGAIHTHAGCLATIAKELRYAFNVDEDSRFFWFTDIGWMMGPWEMIGVTFFGGTLFLFEGAPDYPHPDRLWKTIERHKISVLGISPTAVRLLMKYGDEYPEAHPMPSLKILGSTGEPWDPQSYQWFFEKVGRKRCPIINISGGTEIIGCLLTPLVIQPLKACTLGGPGLGVDLDVLDEEGHPVRGGIGHLACKQPLPSMTKGFLNSEQRYLDTYFSKWEGIWYHGDWAHVDEDGDWFLHGRSDDTIKIAGKRIGPAEFEAALLKDPRVSEAAAIGVPDALKGETCICFAVLKPGQHADDSLRQELMSIVAKSLGKAMAPSDIRFVALLPKTRSAKILRGLIKKIYLGQPLGDTASVENLDSIGAIRASV